MAAEAQRVPRVREQESVAYEPGRVAAIAKRIRDARGYAIEYAIPTVNDMVAALEEHVCQVERISAINHILAHNFNNRILNSKALPPELEASAEALWISMQAVSDLLREAASLAKGITERAYAENRS